MDITTALKFLDIMLKLFTSYNFWRVVNYYGAFPEDSLIHKLEGYGEYQKPEDVLVSFLASDSGSE